MTKIHVLDDNTINKIAAGEVVERPASVIKELIENAMDAGATRIEVEIMAGGTSFMRVTDNGKGMSKEDASVAILRHATSKIQEVSDLNNISTMGFRGEALPTIASVSRFTMLTREPGSDLGTKVEISGGKAPDIIETGCNIGTSIKVEDLFFNTPARKKFLKTNHTEGGKINDFIIKLALSRPDIAFQFINNNKTSVVTPGNGNLFDTVQAIYGGQVADSLLTLKLEDEDLKISGFITKPSMLKSSRTWQTFIVNGRIIQNRAIAKAIDNAYRSLIPKSGFPFTVLNIEVPQRTIDVNVHPQKSEMKFEDESRIFKAVYKSVLDAIRPSTGNLTEVAAVVEKPKVEYTMEPMQFVPASSPAPAAAAPAPSSSRSQGSYQPKTIYEAVSRPAVKPAVSFAEAQAELQKERQIHYNQPEHAEQVADSQPDRQIDQSKPDLSISDQSTVDTSNADWSGRMIPIGQVDLTYIIAQDLKGLYIIDQHAAHERILFDKLSAMADGIPSQQLLVHQLLTFDRKEAAMVEDNKELFAQLGFHMEAAGDLDYRLMEVPADVPVAEAEDIIREILTDLGNMHETTAKEIRQACLATTACRAAIKAGEELNMRQMEILLDELSTTAFPYTCPHGRPTILKFSSEDLAKMFKRTGFGF
ncbi:putative DNA mismatch repair protein MutL [Selenomonas ruminantium subsp. lactilytica TAM6421]|uniref:DNA mismatch repair protein MutL n=1 Tax=Selenomonas ruminantium subsp. lactilytica (strain NBRC 103574 / TAM6421) TaxID=927704 RepID=I0GPR3_SELRL|nr:DNA mismatch repair endonuclease MutL [Selenomonas ruminantium]BAL82750.1 putative DNA mismatch repair protein MutL [Selenomonas ruminantium subsp. lactilytica TAM6421]